MEELVALLPGNLEADETQAFTRDNGPVTLGTEDVLPEFHKAPHETYCSLLHDRTDAAFSDSDQLPAGSRAREPRRRRALQPSGSPHALISFGQQFLLIVAEEKVVRAIRHEYLVTNVGRG